MNLPDGFRIKPKPSTSRPVTLTTRAPTFFNSFADTRAREMGKQKDDKPIAKKPVELKRRPPPTFYLDPGLKRSSASDHRAGSSKASSSKGPALSVLKPPAIGFEIAAARSKLNAKGPSTVVLRKLPIPFYTPGAGPSNANPPEASSSKNASSSSSAVFQPRGFPTFTLPPVKPAIDPEKLKNMVTPSTTPFALATNPTTEAGAKALAAIMAEHKAKHAPPPPLPGDSPVRRDAKGRLKFVRGGLAARVFAFYRSSGTQTALWQHEFNRNDQHWQEYKKGERKAKPYPIEHHKMEVRIVKLVKRPLQSHFEHAAPSGPRSSDRTGPVLSYRQRARLRRAKKSEPRRKSPPLAIALCEIISPPSATRELTRIFFKWPNIDPRGRMFKPTDEGWEAGAVVRVWKPKKGFIMREGHAPGVTAIWNKGPETVRREGEGGASMDVDEPASKKRPLDADEDDMDIDSINPAKYRPAKKPRLDGQHQSKPLPLPRPAPLSIKELKKLPVAERTIITQRFLLVPQRVQGVKGCQG